MFEVALHRKRIPKSMQSNLLLIPLHLKWKKIQGLFKDLHRNSRTFQGKMAFKDFSRTHPEIQGLFKTVRTLFYEFALSFKLWHDKRLLQTFFSIISFYRVNSNCMIRSDFKDNYVIYFKYSLQQSLSNYSGSEVKSPPLKNVISKS